MIPRPVPHQTRAAAAEVISSDRRDGIIGRLADLFCGLLLAAAFIVIEALIGGTRLVFSFPAYALVALLAIVSVLSIARAKPRADRICLITAVIFFGYILGRGLLSPVDYVARADLYSALACLLVYFFVACVFVEARRRVWIVFVLLAIAIVHVCVGALQFRDGSNFMLIPFLQRFDYGRRASGLYISPNHLAGYLEVVGVLGLSLAFWGRWPMWAKLLVLYAAAACYVGILLTASRGGYISSAASLLVLLFLSLMVLRRAGKQWFSKVGGIAVLAGVVIFSAASFFTDKMLFLNDRAQTSVDRNSDVRFDLWSAAVEQWKLRPILGTGSGTYLFYGRQFRGPLTDKDPVEAHNDYLQLLAEYGLVGGAGFLLFFGRHLYCGWRNFRRLGPKRVAVSARLASNSLALQIGALSAIAAYLIHSALDFNLHVPANALVFAFLFGMIANPGVRRDDDRRSSAIVWRLLLVVAGVLMAIQTWRLLPAEYFAEQARVALRDNEPEKSAAFAIRALETEQKNPYVYYYLGKAGMLEGNAAEDEQTRASLLEIAIIGFKKGWALSPRDEIFPLALASIYDATHRFPEAEWMYSDCFRLDPISPTLKKAYQTHLESWRATTQGDQKPSPSN